MLSEPSERTLILAERQHFACCFKKTLRAARLLSSATIDRGLRYLRLRLTPTATWKRPRVLGLSGGGKPPLEWLFGQLGSEADPTSALQSSCADQAVARHSPVQPIEHVRGPAWKKLLLKAIYLPVLAVLICLVSSQSFAQKPLANAPARIAVPRVNIRPQPAPLQQSNLRITGYPAGPTFLPYPTVSTPSNDAIARQNAWAAYNAELHRIPTAPNPNRLAAQENLLDQNRFVQAPQSSRRYNFQFTDNEIRSVQRALRIRGFYSGQVDGILGPDTRRAIETYQLRSKQPVTGQPDAQLNASLGIL
jgi:Putative peptidoglycan binding domain